MTTEFKRGDAITSETMWSLNSGDLLKVRSGLDGGGKIVAVDSVSDEGIKERGDDHPGYFPDCYEFFSCREAAAPRTLRDEFAMSALTGMNVSSEWDASYFARRSYEIADAMMEARK